MHTENERYDESTKAFIEVVKKYPELQITKSEKTAVIETKKYRGLMLMNAEINGKAYDLLIDTGAQATLMNKMMLEEIGVDVADVDMVPVGDSNNISHRLPITCIEKLSFGPVLVEHLPIILIPEPLEFKKIGITFFKVDAVLGWDVLRHLDFELDYNKEELRLVEAEEVEEGATILNIDFPSIMITDSDERVRAWALDTGGRNSWISKELIKDLNLTVARTKENKTFGLHGGAKKDVDIVHDLSIRMYDRQVRYSHIKTGETKCLNHYEYDGVIGNDVLRNACIRIINSQEKCRLL